MSTRWNFSESDKDKVNNRKRRLNVSEWKDKKRKILRDSGKEYVSRRGKGKIVSEKALPSNARGCSEKCGKPGCDSLTITLVHALHRKFYELDYNEQSLLLYKSIAIREPGRRRHSKSEQNSMRLTGFDYSINGKLVCQKTFCNAYSITERRVQMLQQKMKHGEVVPKDKRGTHNTRPHAALVNVNQLIRDHINSFPQELSHYSRKRSSKECLSPDLTVQKMYELFKQKHPNIDISCTKYRKIFRADFNLRFGNPRSDTCKVCDQNFIRLKLAHTEK